MMRKLFLLAMVSGLFMTSCNSDQPLLETPESPRAEVPVTINVKSGNEFSQLKSGSVESAGVESMLYIVYNEADGAYVKHKLIKGDNLGIINDTLSGGQYRIAILAATYVIRYFDHGFDSESFPNGNISFNSAGFQIWGNSTADYFYKDFTLNVSTASLQETVVLERITSKLEIVPQDVAAAPADLESIKFYFNNIVNQRFDYQSKDVYSFIQRFPSSTQVGMSFSASISREDLLKVTAENPITILLFPVSSPYKDSTHPEPIEVPITASFYTSKSVSEMVIKSQYTMERNKVLRLTGNLFTGDSGTNVSVDTEWDADATEESFD